MPWKMKSLNVCCVSSWCLMTPKTHPNMILLRAFDFSWLSAWLQKIQMSFLIVSYFFNTTHRRTKNFFLSHNLLQLGKSRFSFILLHFWTQQLNLFSLPHQHRTWTPLVHAQVANNNFAVQALGIAKTVSGSNTVAPNGTIYYTITATNSGPSTQSNVIITDTLPAGFSLL